LEGMETVIIVVNGHRAYCWREGDKAKKAEIVKDSEGENSLIAISACLTDR